MCGLDELDRRRLSQGETMRHRRLLSGVAVGALAAGFLVWTPEARAADATAAAPAATGLAEVVVTAQRRTENVQRVPIAVQVVTVKQINDAHVTGLHDLQKVTPSLVVQDAASNVNPYIRGVGSTTQGAGYYASVATYIDGVYVTRLASGSFDLDNVESIEVLKGPQGTLYGRNATGGAIVVTSATPHPGDPVHGDLSATYGSYNERKFTGHIAGGLTDQLAFSLGASYDKRDGFITNLNPPGAGTEHDNLNDRDYYALNGALVYQPTNKLSFTLRGSYYSADDRNTMGLQATGLHDYVSNATLATLGLPANPATPLNGTAAYVAGLMSAFGVPGAAAEALAGKLQFSNQFGKTYDNEANGFQGALGPRDKQGDFNAGSILTGSLRVNYQTDLVTITSTSSLTRDTSNSATEVVTANPATYPAGFNGGAIGFSGDFPAHNFQEDFQLTSGPASPIKWVAGADYLYENGLTNLTGDLFGINELSEYNHWTVKSVAGYGQVTIPLDVITHGLSVTGGGRYTSDSYDLVEIPSFLVYSNSISSSAFTYTARLNYQVNNRLLLYAGTSTGFKSGSLNATNHTSPAVTPEHITSYEIGAKADITDGLRLSVAGFDYDYKDIQLQVTSSPLAASFIVNGTSARVYGADFEGSAILTDWARFNFGGLLLHSRYDSDVDAVGYGFLLTAGKRLAGAPNWTFNLGPTIKFPFVTQGTLELNVNAAFSSGYYFDAQNIVGTGGAFDAKSYATLDFNLGYTFPNGRWRVSVWGSNAFNTQYYDGGLVAGQIDKLVIAAPPSQFGVTLLAKF
jgi:iron complex outermembrane receptor protein